MPYDLEDVLLRHSCTWSPQSREEQALVVLPVPHPSAMGILVPHVSVPAAVCPFELLFI